MKTFCAAAFALVLASGAGARAEEAGNKIVVKNRQMIVAITSGKLEDVIVDRPAIIQKNNLAYIIGMTRSVDRACGVLSSADSAALDRLEQSYRAEKAKDEITAAMQVMVVSELDNGATDTAALLTRYDCQALRQFNLTGPLLAFWNKHLAALKG
jgi:hypothetical protein